MKKRSELSKSKKSGSKEKLKNGQDDLDSILRKNRERLRKKKGKTQKKTKKGKLNISTKSKLIIHLNKPKSKSKKDIINSASKKD